MPIPASILRDTATIASTDYPCCVQPRIEKILDSTGSEVVATLWAIFSPTVPVTPRTKVTWNAVVYQVISAYTLSVLGKPHHIEARLREVGARATAGGV